MDSSNPETKEEDEPGEFQRHAASAFDEVVDVEYFEEIFEEVIDDGDVVEEEYDEEIVEDDDEETVESVEEIVLDESSRRNHTPPPPQPQQGQPKKPQGSTGQTRDIQQEESGHPDDETEEGMELDDYDDNWLSRTADFAPCLDVTIENEEELTSRLYGAMKLSIDTLERREAEVYSKPPFPIPIPRKNNQTTTEKSTRNLGKIDFEEDGLPYSSTFAPCLDVTAENEEELTSRLYDATVVALDAFMKHQDELVEPRSTLSEKGNKMAIHVPSERNSPRSELTVPPVPERTVPSLIASPHPELPPTTSSVNINKVVSPIQEVARIMLSLGTPAMYLNGEVKTGSDSSSEGSGAHSVSSGLMWAVRESVNAITDSAVVGNLEDKGKDRLGNVDNLSNPTAPLAESAMTGPSSRTARETSAASPSNDPLLSTIDTTYAFTGKQLTREYSPSDKDESKQEETRTARETSTASPSNDPLLSTLDTTYAFSGKQLTREDSPSDEDESTRGGQEETVNLRRENPSVSRNIALDKENKPVNADPTPVPVSSNASTKQQTSSVVAPSGPSKSHKTRRKKEHPKDTGENKASTPTTAKPKSNSNNKQQASSSVVTPSDPLKRQKRKENDEHPKQGESKDSSTPKSKPLSQRLAPLSDEVKKENKPHQYARMKPASKKRGDEEAQDMEPYPGDEPGEFLLPMVLEKASIVYETDFMIPPRWFKPEEATGTNSNAETLRFWISSVLLALLLTVPFGVGAYLVLIKEDTGTT